MSAYLSLVIPVFNEEDNIAPLSKEISAFAEKLQKPIEIIWVDDGSTDNSLGEIKKIAKQNDHVKYIHFGKNFGQTAALSAGIKHATGEFIVTLDADMQNDVADIPKMLSKMDEGYDVISGWRKNRKDNWVLRTLPSNVANWLISKVTKIPLHDYGCSLKVYKREFLKSFKIYGEMHRFLPAFAGSAGAKIFEMEVNHRPRTKGISKYGPFRIFKVLLDLITVKFLGQYLAKPIYLFGGWGIICGFLSVVFAAITLYKKFYCQIFVKDQPLFLVSIFLGLIAVQMIFLGLICEILIRVYYEVNNRPPYFIKESFKIKTDD
jgi:glycosyltransferase involved in cell wall biosynthesis